MVILPGCLTQMMKFCCPSMIFRKFQETFAHKNSLRHRQIEKALKACSNIAHINRWYQIFLILYPLFVLLPQKNSNLPFHLLHHQSMPPPPVRAVINVSPNRHHRRFHIRYARSMLIHLLDTPLKEMYVEPLFGTYCLNSYGGGKLFKIIPPPLFSITSHSPTW